MVKLWENGNTSSACNNALRAAVTLGDACTGSIVNVKTCSGFGSGSDSFFKSGSGGVWGFMEPVAWVLGEY